MSKAVGCQQNKGIEKPDRTQKKIKEGACFGFFHGVQEQRAAENDRQVQNDVVNRKLCKGEPSGISDDGEVVQEGSVDHLIQRIVRVKIKQNRGGKNEQSGAAAQKIGNEILILFFIQQIQENGQNAGANGNGIVQPHEGQICQHDSVNESIYRRMGRLGFRSGRIPDKKEQAQGNGGNGVFLRQIALLKGVEENGIGRDKQKQALPRSGQVPLRMGLLCGKVQNRQRHKAEQTLQKENAAASAHGQTQCVEEENQGSFVIKQVGVKVFSLQQTFAQQREDRGILAEPVREQGAGKAGSQKHDNNKTDIQDHQIG